MLPSPVKRARIFTFLYYGLQRFRMHAVVGLIPLLLHLSLLFFFGGLVAFLVDVNRAVAYVAAGLLAVIFILYGYVTVLPLIQFDCPYKTPLSNVFWNVRRYFLRRLAFYQGLPDDAHDELPLSLEGVNLHRRSMVNAMIAKATVRSIPREERDNRALVWTMKSLADDDELEPFVEGIPSAIWGRKFTSRFSLPQVLLMTLGPTYSSRPASKIRQSLSRSPQQSAGPIGIPHRASHAQLRERSFGTHGQNAARDLVPQSDMVFGDDGGEREGSRARQRSR
jgi:hypothetical protein